ncbi:hypothetical protein [Amycolatopsis alkalitolerans]|uniref:DUF3137 domain-containing protein n=1 Tax=Amycolatopsis alkalitolerans TaxID=2547244 RepID=A0A5C4LTP9_9PSEU|nr:hypothetical protein [Amycolatopsis alkalitolerans]TNC22477.1 hypothetical protein FG385_24990 [Amycolatopsis alkalitolerans]
MSTGAVIAIAVGGTVLLAAGFTSMGIWLNRSYQRQEQGVLPRLREESARRGWTFAERDDSVAELYTWQQKEYGGRNPVQPFVGPPKARAARNVITGVHRGRPFVAAGLDAYHNGERASVQWIGVRTPAARPSLSVRRAVPLASKVNNALWGEVRIGHPDFDDKFDVLSEDPRFATAVLSPALAELLLRDPRKFSGFLLFADHIDVFDSVSDHRDPAELVAALDLRCDILDRIPETAWGQDAIR